MLNFDGKWRFDSPGAIPRGVVNEFSNLIGRIAGQRDRWRILEDFKSYFANAAGVTSSWSSSASWAETDLDGYMADAADNAPLFIEAFYDACDAIRENYPEIAVPDCARINEVLRANAVAFTIEPPNLVSRISQAQIAVTERQPSLDEQAQELIQQSLKQSERLLSEGRNRPAVQEILWLIETVSTAFRGLDVGSGTVQGKYFNKIAEDLRKHQKGQILEQVLNWVTTLHGYLSSPTGGGIRHGVDIKTATDIQPNEALLFCNLIRSYISFLMVEHSRLSKS